MSSELTYISASQIRTYTTLDALKIDIIKTLARWFPNTYVYNEHAVESWEQKEGTEIYVLYSNSFQFELCQTDANRFTLEMYAVGRFRRHGSSCDYFERVLDGLEQQLKHPSPHFATMTEAITSIAAEECIDFGTPFQYTPSNSVSGVLPAAGVIAESVVYDEAEDAESLDEVESKKSEQLVECERCCGWGCSTCNSACGYTRSENCANEYSYNEDENSDEEDEDSDNEDNEDEDSDNEDEDEDSVASLDEDDRIMSMPLRDMNDVQIDKYIELSGQEPRDECNEWALNFRGGAIPRYSYVNFANLTIADQHVSNITIRRGNFAGCTLRNVQFEQVHFDECNFLSITLDNVTFKDCQFTECDLEPYMSIDNSCIVENIDYEEEMRQAFLEDNVTYRFC
jgi:uncharacterized protein YjbI with pentapeptide repeats